MWTYLFLHNNPNSGCYITVSHQNIVCYHFVYKLCKNVSYCVINSNALKKKKKKKKKTQNVCTDCKLLFSMSRCI